MISLYREIIVWARPDDRKWLNSAVRYTCFENLMTKKFIVQRATSFEKAQNDSTFDLDEQFKSQVESDNMQTIESFFTMKPEDHIDSEEHQQGFDSLVDAIDHWNEYWFG